MSGDDRRHLRSGRAQRRLELAVQIGQLRARLGRSPQCVELRDGPRFVEFHVRYESCRGPGELSDQVLVLGLEDLVAEALKDAARAADLGGRRQIEACGDTPQLPA